MKRLLIDAGNTNIKLAEEDDWPQIVSLPTSRAYDLSLLQFGDVQQVWASNVAGDEVAAQIIRACAESCMPLQFIEARAEQCGVRNSYEVPELLGSDRWAAMIAAWHHVRSACLVVNCGTATTIDALSGEGEFIGGLILPGIALMQKSLFVATALPELDEGSYADFPKNTADAICSGAVKATCGAIHRQHELLDMQSPVLLCGGAAHLLLPHLALQTEMMDNLVLQGLRLIAGDADRV